MPPEAGYAETSSARHSPMNRISAARMGQPQAMAAGPPPFHPPEKGVKQPARIEMIEKEMAKFENPDQDRFSSCLYPSSARSSSSVRTPRRSGSISSGSIPSGTGVLFPVFAGNFQEGHRRSDPRD